MQSAKLLKVITRLTAEYEKEINIVLPRKVAVLAKQHYKANFRQSGFVHGSGPNEREGQAPQLSTARSPPHATT